MTNCELDLPMVKREEVNTTLRPLHTRIRTELKPVRPNFERARNQISLWLWKQKSCNRYGKYFLVQKVARTDVIELAVGLEEIIVSQEIELVDDRDIE